MICLPGRLLLRAFGLSSDDQPTETRAPQADDQPTKTRSPQADNQQTETRYGSLSRPSSEPNVFARRPWLEDETKRACLLDAFRLQYPDPAEGTTIAEVFDRFLDQCDGASLPEWYDRSKMLSLAKSTRGCGNKKRWRVTEEWVK